MNPQDETILRTMVDSRNCLSFFSLPRELRDQIYERILIAPLPIIAWHNKPLQIWQRSVLEATWTYIEEYKQSSFPIQSQALNLIRCSRLMALETAEIFYRNNTFRFLGGWTWDCLVKWLEAIGPQNRASIRKLELTMVKPQQVLRYPDCTRIEILKVGQCPRSAHIYRSPTSENVSAAVERAFALLRQSPRLDLSLLFGEALLPGMRVVGTGENKDLPHLIKKLRSDPLEILWLGQNSFVAFLRSEDQEWGAVPPSHTAAYCSIRVEKTAACNGGFTFSLDGGSGERVCEGHTTET